MMQPLHASLNRFFASIPLVDRRETCEFYNELASRLPRRGGVSDGLEALRDASRRHARALKSMNVPIEFSCVDEHDRARLRLLGTFQEAAVQRRQQCAYLIQVHVLHWLYRPPHGPMVIRLGREMENGAWADAKEEWGETESACCASSYVP